MTYHSGTVFSASTRHEHVPCLLIFEHGRNFRSLKVELGDFDPRVTICTTRSRLHHQQIFLV